MKGGWEVAVTELRMCTQDSGALVAGPREVCCAPQSVYQRLQNKSSGQKCFHLVAMFKRSEPRPYNSRFHFYEMSRVGNCMGTERRLVCDCQCWGEGKIGE